MSASNSSRGSTDRQEEEDEEERHEDRKAAPDLDVETDHRPRRQELDREQRPERDADQKASRERERRDLERPLQADSEHVLEDRLGPVGEEAHRASSGRARRRSTTRIDADIVHTITR